MLMTPDFSDARAIEDANPELILLLAECGFLGYAVPHDAKFRFIDYMPELGWGRGGAIFRLSENGDVVSFREYELFKAGVFGAAGLPEILKTGGAHGDDYIHDASTLTELLVGLKQTFIRWDIDVKLIAVSILCALMGKLGPQLSNLPFADYAQICKLIGTDNPVIRELVLYNVPLNEIEPAVASGAALTMLVDLHAVTLPHIQR